MTLYLTKQLFIQIRTKRVLQQCLNRPKAECVLLKLHERPTKGHYGIYNTILNIVIASYWWPMLHKQTYDMCQTYDISQ